MNVVWFRRDLRINDNPALFGACQSIESAVVAIFCLSKSQFELHDVGNNQEALIIAQLKQLEQELGKLNIPLIVLESDFASAPKVIGNFLKTVEATHLYFNVEIPFDERERDKLVVENLPQGIECKRTYCDSIVPPWELTNDSGEGYKVYTPFSKATKNIISERPLFIFPIPEKRTTRNLEESLSKTEVLGQSCTVLQLDLLSENAKHNIPLPDVSYKSAKKQLEAFCKSSLSDYQETRDYPKLDSTSRLSTALAVGSISVTECYLEAKEKGGELAQKWLNELIWRDFYRSVMWHYPRVSRLQAFNPVDNKLQWNQTGEEIEKFYRAETGVPIIDAAIKQLLETGWMHNRLRMVVASYFTKNLWADWRQGEKFFAKHLFDYDFASNNGGWQWCASVGTDAAPYFRVFNPQSQQKKFDSEASFIKQWLPQLKSYSAKQIHDFEKAEFENYPSCRVSLKETRKASIERFKLAR